MAECDQCSGPEGEQPRIRGRLRLRLFVSGRSINSQAALRNLESALQCHAPGSYDLEIVDLDRDSERALADGVFMTPCLVNARGVPPARLTGRLDDAAQLARFLEDF